MRLYSRYEIYSWIEFSKSLVLFLGRKGIIGCVKCWVWGFEGIGIGFLGSRGRRMERFCLVFVFGEWEG